MTLMPKEKAMQHHCQCINCEDNYKNRGHHMSLPRCKYHGQIASNITVSARNLNNLVKTDSGHRDSNAYLLQRGWFYSYPTADKHVSFVYCLLFCSGLERGVPLAFIISLPAAPHRMWRVVPIPWIIHSAALFGFGWGCFSNSSWGWFDVSLFKVIHHPALLWLHWVQKLALEPCAVSELSQ